MNRLVMNTLKLTYFSVLVLLLSSLSASCETLEDIEGNIGLNNDFTFSLYANNSYTNQSAAAFNNYLFLVPNYRGKIYMYSLKDRRPLYTYTMEAMKEANSSGTSVYHCNQACFGTEYYDINDSFPLLYISQRARNDKRCFTEVFRVVTQKSSHDGEFSAFKLELVQTIYFPPMSESNSLGNVNTVIDTENRLLYTYSRNNTKEDANYRQCKITCFDIPDVYQEEVYLEDSDIRKSFMLDVSAVYMQGACIRNGYMYIARGATSVGYIDINIVNLNTQKIVKRLDLLCNGYRWEPEGCFFYDGQVMISTGKEIWKLEMPCGITDKSAAQVIGMRYYTPNGILHDSPQKGINILIVDTNDGTKIAKTVGK